jgi:hypothetical protein
MLPPGQKNAYEAFYAATADNGILDARTTVVAQLAAAFVAGCYP